MNLTKILDIYSTLVPQASVVDRDIPHIVDWRSVAALSNPQSVDREPRGLCDFLKDLRGRGIRRDGDGLGEILDRAAYRGVSQQQSERAQPG